MECASSVLSKLIKFKAYSNEIEELFKAENSTYNNSYMSNIEPEKLDHVDEWYNFCSHLYKINDLFLKNDIHTMKKPDLVIYDSAALWGKVGKTHKWCNYLFLVWVSKL